MLAEKNAHCFSNHVPFLSTTFKYRYIFVVVIQQKGGGFFGHCRAVLFTWKNKRNRQNQHGNDEDDVDDVVLWLFQYTKKCDNIAKNITIKYSDKTDNIFPTNLSNDNTRNLNGFSSTAIVCIIFR